MNMTLQRSTFPIGTISGIGTKIILHDPERGFWRGNFREPTAQNRRYGPQWTMDPAEAQEMPTIRRAVNMAKKIGADVWLTDGTLIWVRNCR